MKPKSLITCTCMLLMFVFLSCKKEAAIEASQTPPKSSTIEVVDGIIHFSNYNDFFQTMLSVNSMNPEQRQA